MKKEKLIPLDLHMHCVVRYTPSGSANSNAPDVANHTLLTSAMFFIQAKPPQVGERQIKVGEEEIEKEMIGVEGIKEARQGVLREEETEVMTGVVSLQSMIREIGRLNHLEKEFRRLTRETGNRKLKMILTKKGRI